MSEERPRSTGLSPLRAAIMMESFKMPFNLRVHVQLHDVANAGACFSAIEAFHAIPPATLAQVVPHKSRTHCRSILLRSANNDQANAEMITSLRISFGEPNSSPSRKSPPITA